MKDPYYTDGKQTIYLGDCLEVMRGFEDKSFDLVLTDPPYGAWREYENDNLGQKEHIEFLNSWLSECKRITKDNLVVIIGVKYHIPFTKWLIENMNYCWEFVWWKSNGMLNGKATFSKFEKILKLLSKENDLILDPFLGSGTTAVKDKVVLLA